ncbi:cyclin-dependent kinase inhibitor 7-like [Vicia villosa]|uniref:cyclin-dependent kinase inhibitor 7-like n=1 Tax=Vicia villosa TaxID=3911 RepID=UPI00273B8B1D|nr:cyclin-dependent kinase inhibitor 7-like [Vicia villosa]
MNMPNLGRKRKSTETFHHNNKPPFKRFTFINMVEECHSTLTSDEESFPCSCSSNIINNFEESQEVQSPHQVETSTCHDQVIRRREMSLSEEEEVDSIEKKPQKTPSESELDEFFSAAEENIQKQFSNKYNFDIVKDVPLEGRYEWVQLKQ